MIICQITSTNIKVLIYFENGNLIDIMEDIMINMKGYITPKCLSPATCLVAIVVKRKIK